MHLHTGPSRSNRAAARAATTILPIAALAFAALDGAVLFAAGKAIAALFPLY